MLRAVGTLYEQLAGATTVGERIQRLLDSKEMSLSELGRQAGVAKGYLWELVHGKDASRMKPSAETLYAIGHVLGVSVGDLLGKTMPQSHEVMAWPHSLRDYVDQAKVPPEEARVLARINFRGRTPTTVQEWRLLHNTIRVVTEGED